MPELVKIESLLEVPFPPSEVWPVLSRTDWINRAVGLPPVEYEVTPLAHGGTHTIARAKLFGMNLRWEENPFEWVDEQFYFVHRIYHTGPLKEGRMGMDFAGAGSKTVLRMWTHLEPRNSLGKFAAKNLLGPKAIRDMNGAVRHLEEHLAGKVKVCLPKLAQAKLNEQAFVTGLDRLRPLNLHGLERFEELIRESPDVAVSRIRPLAVAREWKVDEREVLRLFLEATRAGLLELSWEVLCPNCRSSRQPLTRSLANLHAQMHCDACQIKYDAQFDRSVELKFSVHPNVRASDSLTYCLAGPGAKPHVISQLIVPPKGTRSATLPTVGHSGLRLRSPQVKEPMLFDHGHLCGTIQISSTEFKQTDTSGEQAVFHNPYEYPVLVILEKVLWTEDILTAARITNLQEFRDLFAREVISPNEQIVVGQQTILFTDLRGSTAMYCGIGDAPAYALVREHFDVLREVIASHEGAIVKTIGDAVMATFSDPANALDAVREMHLKLNRLENAQSQPLSLKSSLHLGPCLAVNANEKLDFFGTTVNLAARLVDVCAGGDVILSEEFHRRPETTNFLRTHSLTGEERDVKFRGFDQPMKVWKVQLI